MKDLKKFTLYWLDGEKEVIEGFNAFNAIFLARWRSGNRVLDFFADGDNHDYEWQDGKWVRKDA